MIRRLRIVAGFYFVFVTAAICLSAPQLFGQQTPRAQDIPDELQAINPDVRAKLAAARAESKKGNYSEAFEADQQALNIARTAGFSRDIALAEDAMASAEFLSGQVQASWDLDRDAVQKAIESSNFVLQADVLTSLSSYSQSAGNVRGALSLLDQALDAAEKSKSLYIKSRVLGEMARLQLLSGEKSEAQKSLDEALRIDSLNNYPFHALHLVYEAYFLLADDKTVKEGIQRLERARDVAASDQNYLALVLAQTALGASYIHIGDFDRGIEALLSMKSGEIKLGASARQPDLRAVLNTPYIRASLLEALGNAYETAKRPADALALWRELYSFSTGTQLTAANAEAAQHLANLYVAQGDNRNAANYYRIAAHQWHTSGNDSMFVQSVGSEALSFMKAGESAEALSTENKLAQIAFGLKDRKTEFLAYLAMAEIYHPAGQLKEARIALEKAQSLVEPGPRDSLLSDELITELYLRLADVYSKLGDQVKQLTATEKALAVCIAGKDQKQINELVAVLRQKFEAIRAEDLISKLYDSGRLFDALTYSQLLWVFQGVPAGTTLPGKAPLYWQLVTGGPFKLVAEPNGDQQLEQDLVLLGPILGFEKWPIIQALSQNYVFSGKNPEQLRLGVDYARQAIALIDQTKTLISPQGLRMHSLCTLAVAYARTNAIDLANQTTQRCMELEKESNDSDDLKFANVANVYVHIFENDLEKAQDSLAFIKKNIGANPIIGEELAIALGKGSHIPDAMAEFSIALKTYQDHKDLTSEARCYAEMAAALYGSDSSDSKKEQLEYLTKAADLYESTHDLSNQASTSLAIGQYFAKAGENGNAERYFRRGLELSSNSGNGSLKGWIALFFGNFYFANKQYDKASELHHEAVVDFNAARDLNGESNAVLAVALDLEATGRFDDALASYMEAQSLMDKAGGSFNGQFVQTHIGTLYERIGFIYERQGRFEQADEAFHRAKQMSEAAGDSRGAGSADLAIAGINAVEGDWQDTLEQATSAQKEFAQIGDRDDESEADAQLAYVFSDRTSTMQNFDLARKYFDDAQKLKYNRLRELDELEIDLQTKRYSEAVIMAKDALVACHERGDSDCIANALISLAEAERLSGDLKASAVTLKDAKPLVTKSRDFYLEGRYFYGEANIQRASGHFTDAVSFYERIIALIEEAKENIDPEFQLSISDTYDFVYDELIDSLYSLYQQENGKPKLRMATQALNYAEANKTRQFEKSWGQTFVSELRNRLPSDVVQQEDVLTTRRNQLSSELQSAISGSDSPSSPNQLQDQLARADSELENFIHMLQRKYPAYAALKYPEPTAMTALPLHPGETMVEFKMTDTATFVWIIRSDEVKGNTLVSFYKVPEQRAWFGTQISKLRDGFNSGQPGGYDPKLSDELFEKLFPAKQAAEILSAHHLIFVPDDVLDLLPFEMLSPQATNGKYVLLSIPSSYFPSAESLRIARTAPRSEHWKEAFLGVGDPITSPVDPRYPLVAALSLAQSASPDSQKPVSPPQGATNQVDKLKSRGFEFDRIPGTAKEIQSVANLFAAKHEDADILLGVNATRKDLLDLDLSRFQYIHFATHGILPVDAGVREPSLVLSYDGTTPDHMLLPISTILHLNIDADDVVLSACNTGSGKVTRAEGVMSLGRAFLTAGASSVTVSLWEVSDESTALLMKQYYQDLLAGKPKDEALADARTWLFQNGYSEPYFWAPFVLVGK